MPTNQYHLIIGSNLGDRMAQLILARQLIAQKIGSVINESGIYETQPWGFPDQPWFLNQVIEVQSELQPKSMLEAIKQVENASGRLPAEKWHARHIDIDILLMGDQTYESAEVMIPHLHLHERNFVLVPLMDLIPEAMHPVLHKTIEELYLECRDTGEVYIFNPDEQASAI